MLHGFVINIYKTALFGELKDDLLDKNAISKQPKISNKYINLHKLVLSQCVNSSLHRIEST